MTDSRIHIARGDVETARPDFDAAIAIFEELESCIVLGRILVLRRGNGDLERARGLFEACGAVADLAKFD